MKNRMLFNNMNYYLLNRIFKIDEPLYQSLYPPTLEKEKK